MPIPITLEKSKLASPYDQHQFCHCIQLRAASIIHIRCIVKFLQKNSPGTIQFKGQELECDSAKVGQDLSRTKITVPIF